MIIHKMKPDLSPTSFQKEFHLPITYMEIGLDFFFNCSKREPFIPPSTIETLASLVKTNRTSSVGESIPPVSLCFRVIRISFMFEQDFQVIEMTEELKPCRLSEQNTGDNEFMSSTLT